MVDVAQWLEHWIVVPGVVGSIPIFHPKNRFCNNRVGFFVYAHATPLDTVSVEVFGNNTPYKVEEATPACSLFLCL